MNHLTQYSKAEDFSTRVGNPTVKRTASYLIGGHVTTRRDASYTTLRRHNNYQAAGAGQNSRRQERHYPVTSRDSRRSLSKHNALPLVPSTCGPRLSPETYMTRRLISQRITMGLGNSQRGALYRVAKTVFRGDRAKIRKTKTIRKVIDKN